MHRFFADERGIVQDAAYLNAEDAGHALRVLRLESGDEVELVGPDCEPFSWVAGSMQDMDGLPLTEPRTPQMRFRARLPKQVPAMSFVRHAVELSGK